MKNETKIPHSSKIQQKAHRKWQCENDISHCISPSKRAMHLTIYETNEYIIAQVWVSQPKISPDSQIVFSGINVIDSKI